MKKIFLLSACILTASAAFCQLRYGVQVSANFSSADLKSADISKLSKDMKTLSGAMLVGEYTVTKNISLRTSLGLLQKGVKLSGMTPAGGDMPAYNSSLTTTLNYLEMPWNVMYNIHLKSARIMLGAGPSIGLGLSGKAKSVTTTSNDKNTEEVKAFADAKGGGLGLKRFDASANALAGIGFKNVYLTASYLYSVTNISNADGNYKNRGIQLSLGYMFK